MRKTLGLIALISSLSGCDPSQEAASRRSISTFSAVAEPLVTVTTIGADTMSDSAWISHIKPEPDGESVAFIFADPTKGATHALALARVAGTQTSHLVWPDSVTLVWWSGPHELRFTAGTGRGVYAIVDAHAAALEALAITDSARALPAPAPSTMQARTNALARLQSFIDSLRVQPEGTPQRSVLRYRADTIIVAAGDTLAAAHVAADADGGSVNPAWYVVHIESGSVQPIDSLVGRATGLPRSAGGWDNSGTFYYAKERSIWRARVTAR
jgi:hypothetical protein